MLFLYTHGNDLTNTDRIEEFLKKLSIIFFKVRVDTTCVLTEREIQIQAGKCSSLTPILVDSSKPTVSFSCWGEVDYLKLAEWLK